ncbi:hypothetical protein M422DRAFT_42243 [Sphaerobolus stellatus SS14]|nr:hypothetical protein M422DRAFT_42243 [Sphaerobolus stellatus SS14]
MTVTLQTSEGHDPYSSLFRYLQFPGVPWSVALLLIAITNSPRLRSSGILAARAHAISRKNTGIAIILLTLITSNIGCSVAEIPLAVFMGPMSPSFRRVFSLSASATSGIYVGRTGFLKRYDSPILSNHSGYCFSSKELYSFASFSYGY